ncbi:hypothetical protein Tco_1239849 [Tanacetum coccineum]
MPTEMELVLEYTQQGTSHKVSVSTEGVEELKRKVKINGEKKEALLTLRQKPGNPDGRSYWIKTSQDSMPQTDKIKEVQERCLIQVFKTKKQQQYEHVGPNVTSAQDDDKIKNDDKRLCLVDDLKEVQVHIQVKPIKTSSSLKSKIITSCSQDEAMKTNMRAQD